MLALFHQPIDCFLAVLVQKGQQVLLLPVDSGVLLKESIVDAVRLEGSRVLVVYLNFVDRGVCYLVVVHLTEDCSGAPAFFSVGTSHVFVFFFIDRVLLPGEGSSFDVEILF